MQGLCSYCLAFVFLNTSGNSDSTDELISCPWVEMFCQTLFRVLMAVQRRFVVRKSGTVLSESSLLGIPCALAVKILQCLLIITGGVGWVELTEIKGKIL